MTNKADAVAITDIDLILKDELTDESTGGMHKITEEYHDDEDDENLHDPSKEDDDGA